MIDCEDRGSLRTRKKERFQDMSARKNAPGYSEVFKPDDIRFVQLFSAAM